MKIWDTANEETNQRGMNKGNPQIQGERRYQDEGFPQGIEINNSRLEQSKNS